MAIPPTYPGVVALSHLCDLVGGDDTTAGFALAACGAVPHRWSIPTL